MIIRGLKSFDFLLLVFVSMALVMTFPAGLLRLSGAPFFQTAYFDIVFVLFSLLAICNLWLVLDSPLPNPKFALSLLFFPVLVFSIGVVRGNDGVLNGLKYFALPLFVYALLLGRQFVLVLYESEIFWKIILGSHLLCLVWYHISLYGKVYPGIGVPSISFASIYFLTKRMYVSFAISIFVLFLEGKRSLLLALLVTIIFMRLVRLSVAGRLLYTFFGVMVFVAAMYFGLNYLAGVSGSSIVNRINLINPFSSSFDLLLGSSGRAGELFSYFEGRDIMKIAIGSGSGFSYEWSLGYDSAQNGEIKGYFHMTPANYLAAGGVLGLALFLWMALLPFRAGALREENETQTVAFGLGIFCIVQSLFGFSLATDAISLIFIFGPMMLLADRRDPSNVPTFPSGIVERPV